MDPDKQQSLLSPDAPTGEVPPTEPGIDVEPGEIPDKLYFRIGEVSQIVNVDTHVLRYWESEFRMKPHRSSSGQRLYRKPDVSRFLRIKRLLHEEGYTISGARKVLNGTMTTDTKADPTRVREALDRLEGIRRRILAIRDDLELDIV